LKDSVALLEHVVAQKTPSSSASSSSDTPPEDKYPAIDQDPPLA
jgi:hypothetical protein